MIYKTMWSKFELINLYNKNCYSLIKISKFYSCSLNTVKKALEYHNISIRPQGYHLIGGEGYVKGKKMLEETKRKISKAMKGRTFSEKTIEKMRKSAFNRNRSGGKYTGKDGYVYINLRYHPNKIKNNYILEHRLMIEAYLNKVSLKKWIQFGLKNIYPKNSKFLLKTEVVHHINGIRDDNRIENLMLFPNQSAHHKWKHVNEKSFICKFCNRNQKEIV